MRVYLFFARYGETALVAALFLGALYGAVACAIAGRYLVAAVLLTAAVAWFDILRTFLDSDDWRAVLRKRAEQEEDRGG